MRFEYKRALGHAWYLHKVFWLYSFFFSSGALIYHMYGKNGDEKNTDEKAIEDPVFYILGV